MKIIEGAACNQIMDQAIASGKFEKFQLAYHTKHSTETALLRVREEILKCMDKGEIVCLLLLDLSATFDTIDKTVLLSRVKYRFGYGGKVLDWIGSYLTGRSQKVAINDNFSSEQGLNYGVPQALWSFAFSALYVPTRRFMQRKWGRVSGICRQYPELA